MTEDKMSVSRKELTQAIRSLVRIMAFTIIKKPPRLATHNFPRDGVLVGYGEIGFGM